MVQKTGHSRSARLARAVRVQIQVREVHGRLRNPAAAPVSGSHSGRPRLLRQALQALPTHLADLAQDHPCLQPLAHKVNGLDGEQGGASRRTLHAAVEAGAAAQQGLRQHCCKRSTSWLDSTSQMPSQARIANSSPSCRGHGGAVQGLAAQRCAS